ncbi:MAG TPA: long-chain fatty acid--CoA ligase, partial [Candidatus Atribacteria bacterium]|nr:long-chain fatty acid--CoA ligase [Candidatus Atribacteria bacterium]
KNIFPEEIELVLSQSPYIAEVLVIGKYDPVKRDEAPYAIVYPNYEELEFFAEENNIELTDDKIKEIIKKEIQELSRELADYKRVKDFELRKEEFPKTSTKKIKRFLFQEERHIQKR